VRQEDQSAFVILALEEFKSMHPGNAVRFGLSPLEFVAWKPEKS